MDVGRAFTYLFRDRRWVRTLGIVALLGLPPAALNLLRATLFANRVSTDDPIPSALFGVVVGLAGVPVSGYVLRIVRGVAAGADLPLPGWSDVGGLVGDGLKAWGVLTIWTLPRTLLELLGGLGSGEADGDGRLPLRALVALMGLILIVVEPAAQARLATTGSFAAGLDVGAVFGTVRRNLGGYLVLLLVALIGGVAALGLVVGLVWAAWGTAAGQPDVRDVTRVGAALGPVSVGPCFALVLAHLSGQAYRRAAHGTVWEGLGPRRPRRRGR